jgi:hypothetical protein
VKPLVVTPTKKNKVIVPIFGVLLLFGVLVRATWPSWSPLEWNRAEWIDGFLVLFDIWFPIAYLRMAVVLDGDSIRVRGMMFSSREHLPSHVTVSRNEKGRVILTSTKTGHLIATFARDFGPADEVESAVRIWLRINGRLGVE